MTEAGRASLREACSAAIARAGLLMDAVKHITWLLDESDDAARSRVLVAVNSAATALEAAGLADLGMLLRDTAGKE